MIAGTAAHANAVRELERMAHELRALQRRQARLERSQPSILRPHERARHRAEVGGNGDDCRALGAGVARQHEVVRAMARRLQVRHAAAAERDAPRRIEQQLVEEELRRRASMERDLSSEINREPLISARTDID